MKLKVIEPVIDYEGKTIPHEETILTWRTVIFQALNSLVEGKTLKADDKKKCYILTKRVFDLDEVDLSISERAFILEKIGDIYTPLVFGRAQEFFDKEETPAQPNETIQV